MTATADTWRELIPSTYWQEKVWAALAETYQPTQLAAHIIPATVVADGPRMPKAHALGPRLAFVLLAVARLQDATAEGEVRGVTLDELVTVVGGSKVAAGRALRELDQSRWVARYKDAGPHAQYFYKVTL